MAVPAEQARVPAHDGGILPRMTARRFDVIIVGGGPAGAAAGWALARKGVNVAVLERSHFPRDKVCGDFIEPAGLRLAAAMGADLATGDRLPITRNCVYFGPHLAWSGAIPYYGHEPEMPPHGMIVPRAEFDDTMLARAADAGASVRQGAAVTACERRDGLMHIGLKDGETLTAPLVVGADGTESLVARSAGIVHRDRRHIGIARRMYLEDVETDGGEACIWFDSDQIPGYGWMFPMAGGRANFGVGLLSEAAARHDLSVPASLTAALDRLRLRHPGCRRARAVGRPMGGIVKAYGAITRNHFDGGLLVGDAGCFADPITGEGITQGMESAVIAARTLVAALERGRFEAADLAGYEADFRGHFDPGMRWLTFCAALMRNWHMRDWLWRVTRRGFEEAQQSPDFARTAGAGFGGLDIRPRDIVVMLWTRIFARGLEDGVRALAALIAGRSPGQDGLVGDLDAWRRGWQASLADDPAFHWQWLADLAKALAALLPVLATDANPRRQGVTP